jgi:nucleoside-diphosphate-sugar epimerase
MLTHQADADRQPSRVLILGRSGFVAQYLIAELSTSGLEVEALGRPDLDLTVAASISTLSDLLRPDDTVVILSALTPDKGRDFRTLMSNLRMAEHLCEVFEQRSCAHVVYLSSDAVYEGRETPLTENSSRQPVDLYAVMHTSREMMLQSALASRRTPFCILRPSALFGPGDTHNSYGPNRFVREAFDAGTITLFGQGEDLRAHLYVRDAVRLITACVTRMSAGTLNLAPPEAVSFRQVAELVKSALPFPVELKFKVTAGAPSPTRRPFDVHALTSAFSDFEFTPLRAALSDFVAAHAARVGGPAAPSA